MSSSKSKPALMKIQDGDSAARRFSILSRPSRGRCVVRCRGAQVRSKASPGCRRAKRFGLQPSHLLRPYGPDCSTGTAPQTGGRKVSM